MKVRELMTPWPLTVTPQASLRDAVEEMLRRRVRGLPVCEGGEILGMLTDRDVRMALGPASRELDLAHLDGEVLDEPVRDWMTPGAATVAPEDDVGVTCRALATLRVGSLPVVDGEDGVVGILSVTDLLEAAADLFDDLREE